MIKEIIVWSLILSVVLVARVSSIADIKSEYSIIRDSMPLMKKIKRSLDELSSEGTEAIIYKDSSGVRLIELNRYFEIGNIKEEYYFKDGELFFVFEKKKRYNAPPSTEFFDESKSDIQESRSYFLNGKIVKWIDGKRVYTQSSRAKRAMFRKGREVRAKLREIMGYIQ